MECKFPDYLKQWQCETHDSEPACCTVGKAELEGRYKRLAEDHHDTCRHAEDLESRLLGTGATCATCGFRYGEHEGHIIACPVCRVKELEMMWLAKAEVGDQRIREAEAQAAATSELLTKVRRLTMDDRPNDATMQEIFNLVAAFSPDAGRALLARVHALEAVVSVAQSIKGKCDTTHQVLWLDHWLGIELSALATALAALSTASGGKPE